MNNALFIAEKTTFLEAFALISNPETWCQETLARDSNGKIVDPTDPAACKWCSVGAYKKVMQDDSYWPEELDFFTAKKYLNILTSFNDTREHGQVVDLWREFGKGKGYLI